jgi:6-pyruvoyltetrahydropterin/6-carboxytetrahydropterin synthase
MNSRIYKQVFFDASHRLLHYNGKCARLHGHRWKVEVWIDGPVDERTMILLDYNRVREIIETFDHQVLLNKDDPMVRCLSEFQEVITTTGDPTSEEIAGMIHRMLAEECQKNGLSRFDIIVRVWESPTCYSEYTHDHQ